METPASLLLLVVVLVVLVDLAEAEADRHWRKELGCKEGDRATATANRLEAEVQVRRDIMAK